MIAESKKKAKMYGLITPLQNLIFLAWGLFLVNDYCKLN